MVGLIVNGVISHLQKPTTEKYIAAQDASSMHYMNRRPSTRPKEGCQKKEGVLVLPEYKKYGLGSYGTSKSSHRKSDFTEENEAIQKEMEFLKLRKNKRKLAEVLK